MHDSRKQITLGDIRLELDIREVRLWPFVDRRYQKFFSSEMETPCESIELRAVADSKIPALDDGDPAVTLLEDGATIKIVRGRGVAIWDRQRHQCRIEQSERDFQADVTHPDYVLDSVVRIMLSFLLLDKRGFLIHSAGLIRDGNGYLFAGVSGAGKSTVARISAPMTTVLSDDLTLLRHDDSGDNVYGTPFFGEFSTGGANESAPLKGIYFLQKGRENRLVENDPALAWRQLLRSVMFFGEDRESTQRIIDLAWDVCRRVPCYTLQFLPDDSFWNLIHE